MEYKLDKEYNNIEKFYIDLIDGIINEIPNMTWREVYETVVLAAPTLHKYGLHAMSSAMILANNNLLGIKEPEDRIDFAEEQFNDKFG